MKIGKISNICTVYTEIDRLSKGQCCKSRLRLGADALAPNDAQWLQSQNAELQRQLREALAQIDDLNQQPELRRTKLTGPGAEVSVLAAGSPATKLKLVYSIDSRVVCNIHMFEK